MKRLMLISRVHLWHQGREDPGFALTALADGWPPDGAAGDRRGNGAEDCDLRASGLTKPRPVAGASSSGFRGRELLEVAADPLEIGRVVDPVGAAQAGAVRVEDERVHAGDDPAVADEVRSARVAEARAAAAGVVRQDQIAIGGEPGQRPVDRVQPRVGDHASWRPYPTAVNVVPRPG